MRRRRTVDDESEVDDYCGATGREVIESLREEILDRDQQIKRLRAALTEISKDNFLYRSTQIAIKALKDG
jgi:hypothetical protein